MHCSLCTDTASYGTDTVSYGTNTESYGISMASYGSSGKKGLPALCSVLPPASSAGVLCCTATRTLLSVLSHTLYNQPLGPPSVKYLRHSADLPLSLL